MSNLFILIGLPGAGKSTFAKAMMETSKNVVYLSSDELRKERPEDKDNHVAIFAEMHRRTLEALSVGTDVIYDSTNLELKFRKMLFDKVKANVGDARVFAVFIHNGLENAVLQSHNRENRDDVNDELIAQMYKTMQLPSVGKDCDGVVIPDVSLVDDKYKLIESSIFTKDTFNQFVERVKAVDSALVIKYNKGIEGDKDEI